MYHRKKRILFNSLYSSTGYKFSKIISQQGARFLRKSIDFIPKIFMTIYTSAIYIYSMTNIKTVAHIPFQTSFSQRYVEIEKRGMTLQVPIQQKRKKTGRLIFISNSYETSILPYLLHQLFVILMRNLYEYKKKTKKNSSLGHEVQIWTIPKTNKEHN